MEPSTQAEAERLLGIAEKLLEEKDLDAARDFALLAQETEPLIDGSDRIMAIADVLTAADKRINDNHHNWYAILQIDIHRRNDAELIKQQYRHLALLLHPDKNKFPFAGLAFTLVGDAWAVLSDLSRKTTYDKELFEFLKVDLDAVWNQREKEIQNSREKMPSRRNAKAGSAELAPSESIWTLCPYCYNLYEYLRIFEGCCLRCVNCERAFQVVEIPLESMPPTVTGKEAYYCSWAYWMVPMFPTQLNSWPSAGSLPNVTAVPVVKSGERFVNGRSPESRPTQQEQEKTASPIIGATGPRKRARSTSSPSL